MIELLKPHEGQIEILQSDARFKIVNCSRRFGKTSLGEIIAAEVMIKHKEECYWFSPNHTMATEVWERMKNTFYPLIVSKNEQQKRFKLSTGGVFRIFSGVKYENIRGLKPYYVIIDEAAIIPKLKDLWTAVVRPALADKKGKALFLSTPKGQNYFYELYLLGLDEDLKDYQSFKKYSWQNPYIPKSEIYEAKKTTPIKIFKQEYLAEFLLDAGEVFKGVSKVALNDYFEPYEGSFIFGIDLAKKNDYTVVSVWDIQSKENVDMLRINKISWVEIKKEIKRYADIWNPINIIMEENHNDSVIDDLKSEGYPVRGFYTSSKSKPSLINNMVVSIENEEVKLLNDINLIQEFQAYEMKMSESGHIKYSAPSGYHDDIVMANCLAWQYVKRFGRMRGVKIPILKGNRFVDSR